MFEICSLRPRGTRLSMNGAEIRHRVRGRWKRWTWRLLLAGATILCIAAIIGAIYEFVSERKDTRRFSQEGRSVDVGGFRLNIHCTGEGGPVVILDSGMGIPAMGWDLVQPDVEKFTRVCSYDLAGYGWSDPGPLPRTSLQIPKGTARATAIRRHSTAHTFCSATLLADSPSPAIPVS